MTPDEPAAPETEARRARRTALVEAAFARIARDGFEGLRTRDVAADVGVNIATLHYYFPTKEALIRGVIGHAMSRFASTMPSEGTAVEQLRGHLRAIARLLKEEPRLWTVMGELVLRAPRDPDLARVFGQTDTFWHRTMSEMIARGIREGALDPSLDVADTAALVICAIRGVSMPTVSASQIFDADNVFRQLERILGLPPA